MHFFLSNQPYLKKSENNSIFLQYNTRQADLQVIKDKYNIGDKIKKTTLSSVSARVVSIISHVDSLADFSCLADNIQKYIKISYD